MFKQSTMSNSNSRFLPSLPHPVLSPPQDQALEAQCSEALGLVRSYEHLRFYSGAPVKVGGAGGCEP